MQKRRDPLKIAVAHQHPDWLELHVTNVDLLGESFAFDRRYRAGLGVRVVCELAVGIADSKQVSTGEVIPRFRVISASPPSHGPLDEMQLPYRLAPNEVARIRLDMAPEWLASVGQRITVTVRFDNQNVALPEYRLIIAESEPFPLHAVPVE
jgi:hypothetical protein